MKKIVLVGGGISGLSLAFRLEQLLPGAEVRVLEKRASLGGNVGTVERDGFRVETGPNGFLDNNPSTLNLCHDLGLKDQLIPASDAARKHRFLFHRGRMYELPSSLWSFLNSKLLGWRGKWALATERYRRSEPLSADESIDQFARRRTNAEVAETLVDAFVTGIHAGDPALLSLQAAFPRLASLEAEYGSVVGGMAKRRGHNPSPNKGLRTWSLERGLGTLIDGISSRLRTPPGTGITIQSLRYENGWQLESDRGETWSADVVALMCPAFEQATLLEEVDTDLSREIDGIAYNRVVVVALGYRREEVAHPLNGFGYLTPGKQGREVLGTQWCLSIYPGRAPTGAVLLRAICGGWHRPEVVSLDDDKLLSLVRAEMRLALGIKAVPIFHHIVRWERAIPQYHVGHTERVLRIEALRQKHHGLILGGNCYRGVAMNDCVEQAERLALEVRLLCEKAPAIRPPSEELDS